MYMNSYQKYSRFHTLSKLAVFIILVFFIFLIFLPHYAIILFLNSLRPGVPYQFFTNNYHFYFQLCCGLISAGLVLVLIYLNYKKKSYINLTELLVQDIFFYFNATQRNILGFTQSEDKLHRVVFIIIILIGVSTRLLYIDRPVFHDEAKTFHDFISRDWINTITNYYVPNNHVFHSILSRISYLVGGNQEWVIRLPVFIFGVITMLLSYVCSRILFNKNIAIISCALIANNIPLVSYSVNARGYIIITCLFLFLITIIRQNKDRESLFFRLLFVVVSSIGLWTIPTMIIPLLFMLFWYCLEGSSESFSRRILNALIIGLVTAITSFVLYSPLILRCGIDSLISNQYVQASPISTIVQDLPSYIYNYWQFFTAGYPKVGKVFILILFALGIQKHIYNTEHRNILISILLMLFTVFFIIKQLPPERSLLFVSPILWAYVSAGVFSLSLFFSKRFNYNLKRMTNIISLVIFGYSTFICLKNNGIIEKHRSQTFIKAEEIIVDLKSELGLKDKIETSSPLAGPIRYYMKKNKIQESQLHWHNAGKNKNDLFGSKKIFVITRKGRNNLESFGYSSLYSLDGFSPPKIWKEYNGKIKVYIIRSLP